MIRFNAYEALGRVAQIEDKQARREALRQVLAERRSLAMAIQYAYHPDVQFDLPAKIPAELIRKSTNHDDYSVFDRYVRKLPNLFVGAPAKQEVKIRLFAGMVTDMSGDDSILLMAIKDKKLPWKTLNKSFVYKAVPELFPPVEVVEDDE